MVLGLYLTDILLPIYEWRLSNIHVVTDRFLGIVLYDCVIIRNGQREPKPSQVYSLVVVEVLGWNVDQYNMYYM